ncbi:MAG: small ribosomal subunit Rsm22 family protein [Myxococcales bacterium]|jgi:SAM-dependent methyltransferase
MPIPAPSSPSPALLAAVDRVASARFGRADLQGAALSAAVAEVSRSYTRARQSLGRGQSDAASRCARLRFFLPRDYPKVQGPLAELLRAGVVSRKPELSILDLGSGLGTTALGAARILLDAGACERVSVTAVDLDAEALALGEALARELTDREGWPLSWRSLAEPLSVERLPRAGDGGHHDLILLGLVLNELDVDRQDVSAAAEAHSRAVRTLARRLQPEGAMVILEPALRTEGRMLCRVRDALAAEPDGPHVFAPCLHREACPMLVRQRDWCHERLPLPLPPALATIARGAGLREAQLTYSYLTLTASDRNLAEVAGAAGTPLRLVSGPLRSKGKLELLACAPQQARVLRRLDRRLADDNRVLDTLGRGSVIILSEAPANTRRIEVQETTDISVIQDFCGSGGAAP